MRLDLAPGNRFPDVELPDDSGHYRKLSELAGGILSSQLLRCRLPTGSQLIRWE